MFAFRRFRLIPLAILLLLLHVRLPGQQITGRRYIDWTPVSNLRQDQSDVPVLHFRNATYELNTLLPKYYEVLKIENKSEYQVGILDPVFQEADNELVQHIQHIDELPSSIRPLCRISNLRKEKQLQISFVPLRLNSFTGRVEMLTSFKLILVPSGTSKKSNSSTQRTYAASSVLASGHWVRIKVMEDGIYRLSYDQLRELGINEPANVRVYGNGGGMLPMMNSVPRHDDLVENNISHRADHILFYGQGPDEWVYDSVNDFFDKRLHDYDDGTYYFLTSDLGKGSGIPEADVPEMPNYFSEGYDALAHHETEDINLIQSGREWYGEHFDIVTEHSFGFSIPGLQTERDIYIKTETVARSSTTSNMQVYSGENLLGTLSMAGVNIGSYSGAYATRDARTFTTRSDIENPDVTMRYLKSTSSSEAWLNYITLNARSDLEPDGNTLIFRDRLSAGPGRITEFTIRNASGHEIWDITDPIRPVKMPVNNLGDAISFRASTENIRDYILFNPQTSYLNPVTSGEGTGMVPNQDLHAVRDRNYVIVSHPDFLSQARILAAHRHDRDKLDTIVVTPQQIYNEFSSGCRDVTAIRDFLKMLYDRAGSEEQMPKYVLLYGDGSYDNKGEHVNNTNFIPTYQSPNSISATGSYVTDDFFGLLDEGEGESSGLVDIGIGRFPASSIDEAQSLLEKTLSYDQPDRMGDWRNAICFIGDDGDRNTHMRQADELARYVDANHPDYNISKIYLDAFTRISTPSGPRYPDVNQAITDRVGKGALILNYTGHGGANGLAHERVIRMEDVLSWENSDRLPLFVTATCEFSRFDEYEKTSAGEMVLLNPVGGGVALLTTTRLVYSSPNHVLNERFYEHVFDKDSRGENLRLGDIIRLTKNTAGGGINKRNFTLLGDPALELAYPQHNILIDSINGVPVIESTDTLKALASVSISGHLADGSGQRLSGFNGTVYPTIFDKSGSFTTLNNDGKSVPMTFEVRNRILYKGKATVKEGSFSFSFIVPKDIAYNFGEGKLSFYAENGTTDASGFSDSIIIGGSANALGMDLSGPRLRLFMNDTNFLDGGMTDPNPVLLAYVSDSNGINTLGNGIGHDLTAVIDGNSSQVIVLNDYYESDRDSYRSGKIRYGLKDLKAGKHSIRVKVWDVHNNSAEETIEFIVNAKEELVLDHMSNHPNPFTDHTRFWFEHNHSDADLDVRIDIYSISGKLVKTIEYQSPASGYRVGPIEWDGSGDYGGKISRGIYIYRMRVRSSTGHIAEKSQKLVILN